MVNDKLDEVNERLFKMKRQQAAELEMRDSKIGRCDDLIAEKNREIGDLRQTTQSLERLISEQADQIKILKNELQKDVEAKLAQMEGSLQEVVKQQLTFSAVSEQQTQDTTKGAQQSSRQLSVLQSQLETFKTVTLPNAVKSLEQKIEDQRITTKGVMDKKLKQHQKDAKKLADQSSAEQAKRLEATEA